MFIYSPSCVGIVVGGLIIIILLLLQLPTFRSTCYTLSEYYSTHSEYSFPSNSLTFPGKGSFGEIFLASDDVSRPVSDRTAKYVVKIEPHSNGPLFVEIHCLMNTAKVTGKSTLVHYLIPKY